MLLAPFSFQGNEEGIFRVHYTETEEKRSVNNLDGAITISQSQIVKIKTPHLTVEGERMLKNKHRAHSAPLLTLASFSIYWHY